MIESLDEAWDWYRAVRTLAHDVESLASHWDDPAISEVLRRSNRLRDRTSASLRDMAQRILDDLDDLSVLLLFSVFEATFRALAGVGVERQLGSVGHPAVQYVIRDLKDTIENGSFGRLTDAYRKLDADLTAQVDQVRRFRNWVAHGRHGQPENQLDPEAAFARLRRYLDLLAAAEARHSMTNVPPVVQGGETGAETHSP